MPRRYGKETRFFCLPEELMGIVSSIAAATGARLCKKEEREGLRYFSAASEAELDKHENNTWYLCYPKICALKGLRSGAYIVLVLFPKRLNKNELSMGGISMRAGDSDLSMELRSLQEGIFRKLRKELTKRFKSGAWARSSSTGAEHFYRDIRMSNTVCDCARNGLVLRPQWGGGFVTYSPDRAQ